MKKILLIFTIASILFTSAGMSVLTENSDNEEMDVIDYENTNIEELEELMEEPAEVINVE